MRKFDSSFHKSLKFNVDTFPKQNLDIEIGCGVGLHPILYSKQNKDRNLIAIEHTAEKFEKFKRRYENNETPRNLYAVHANAISFITSGVEDLSVDNFFILYPNPNPLNKHANKRFHNMPFMEILISKLKDGGRITLATNEEFYLEEAIDRFVNVWKLEIDSREDLRTLIDFKPRTHFEIKYLKRGEACYQAIFRKTTN